VVRTADPDSAACPIGQDGAPAVCHRSGAAHYLLQQFFDHCDPAMEEALHDIPLYREFAWPDTGITHSRPAQWSMPR